MMDPAVHSGRSPSGVEFHFELLPGSVAFDPDDDNIDVELVVHGKRYFPTVYSLANIATLMARHAKTGECGGGAYLMGADMVIVRRLSIAALESAFAAIIDEGDLEHIGSEDDCPE